MTRPVVTEVDVLARADAAIAVETSGPTAAALTRARTKVLDTDAGPLRFVAVMGLLSMLELIYHED